MDPASFVREVLLPLATGGALTVRAPLDHDDVQALILARGSMPGSAELAAERRAVMAHYLLDLSAPSLDEDSIRLGAAIHNLCYLLGRERHEELRGRLARVAAYSARLADLPPPEDEEALCARHTLVRRLRSLTRRDVRVRFWAGQREFRGEPVPKRLLSWQSVRRVREEHSTVDLFGEALAIPPLRAILGALLGASPLTDLLEIDRADPPVDLIRAAPWLRTPRIARAVADEYLRRGLPAIEAPWCMALLAACNRKNAEDPAAISLMFHSHLHLLDVVARPPRDREGHLQVIRGYVQGRERAVVDGFGLYAAADRAGLGRPRDLDRDFELERNVQAYAEACTELVGEPRLLELTGVVGRGVGAHARLSRVMMKGPHGSE